MEVMEHQAQGGWWMNNKLTWVHVLTAAAVLLSALCVYGYASERAVVTFDEKATPNMGREKLPSNEVLIYGTGYIVRMIDSKSGPRDPVVHIIGPSDDIEVQGNKLRMSYKPDALGRTGTCELKLETYGSRIDEIAVWYSDRSNYLHPAVDGPEVAIKESARSQPQQMPLNPEKRSGEQVFRIFTRDKETSEALEIDDIRIRAWGYDEVEIYKVEIVFSS
jgi:hypothetical protein